MIRLCVWVTAFQFLKNDEIAVSFDPGPETKLGDGVFTAIDHANNKKLHVRLEIKMKKLSDKLLNECIDFFKKCEEYNSTSSTNGNSIVNVAIFFSWYSMDLYKNPNATHKGKPTKPNQIVYDWIEKKNSTIKFLVIDNVKDLNSTLKLFELSQPDRFLTMESLQQKLIKSKSLGMEPVKEEVKPQRPFNVDFMNNIRGVCDKCELNCDEYGSENGKDCELCHHAAAIHAKLGKYGVWTICNQYFLEYLFIQ